MSYQVTHLANGETFTRPSMLRSPHQGLRSPTNQLADDPAIADFHKQLPDYAETQLHPLQALAKELGLASVFLKDESTRFGLPSFKIAGASWAVHRAICQRLGLPASTPLTELRETLAEKPGEVRLVTCTDGNWGRAVARMCKVLDVPATIYVPGFMNEYTQGLIHSEGANVKVVDNGAYDDAIVAVQKHAREDQGALMVMDTSWQGYEEVPLWVTQGYLPLLTETDRQVSSATKGTKAMPDVVFGSVGVGSWMHAVTSHYTKPSSPGPAKVFTVEPDTAASFKESLHKDAITPIKTGDTIMCGMNCGTTSTIAWPVLRAGVYGAATVTDLESHRCVEYLQAQGINAGPCGAASIAALRKACAEGLLGDEEERRTTCVVLFSTEGNREYEVPQ